jgi:hypothetical protein
MITLLLRDMFFFVLLSGGCGLLSLVFLALLSLPYYLSINNSEQVIG